MSGQSSAHIHVGRLSRRNGMMAKVAAWSSDSVSQSLPSEQLRDRQVTELIYPDHLNRLWVTTFSCC